MEPSVLVHWSFFAYPLVRLTVRWFHAGNTGCGLEPLEGDETRDLCLGCGDARLCLRLQHPVAWPPHEQRTVSGDTMIIMLRPRVPGVQWTRLLRQPTPRCTVCREDDGIDDTLEDEFEEMLGDPDDPLAPLNLLKDVQ